MNDQNYHCDLPEGHKGWHENGTYAWTGFAYHTAEPQSEIKHIKYAPAFAAEEKNGNDQEK
jgi:hypothetical protein